MKSTLSQIVHYFLLVSVLYLLAACQDSNNQSVLVIGDSLSTGYEVATPWPTRLADNPNIFIDNTYSVNGVETSYGLSIFEQAAGSAKFDSVVILLGTNDSINGNTQTAAENLQAMIDMANARRIMPMVVTLPEVTHSNYRNGNIDIINQGIYQLSGATIIDLAKLDVDWSRLLVDGVHPNDAGQALIAATIANALDIKLN